MNNYTTITRIILVLMLSFTSINSNAQVGINTKMPRKTLEVNGTTQITGTIDVGTIRSMESKDAYTFLMQETSGNIRALDVANVSTGNALGYIQAYEIQEVYFDFLRDFDTGIDANRFVMAVTSYNFDREVAHFPLGPTAGFAIPSVQAFKSGGTWHLKANYPTIATHDLSNGTWKIETLIFTSDLVKQFPDQITNMGDKTTGSATSALLD